MKSAFIIFCFCLFVSFNTTVFSQNAPSLISPTDNATGLPTNPIFTWTEIPGATYTFQVSSTTGFWWNPIDVSGITGTSFIPSSGIYMYTPYYWRVGATVGGVTTFSQPKQFTTGGIGNLNHNSQATTLISPANGSTGLNTNPTFTWNAVPGATYVLQVSTSDGFWWNPVNVSGITGTSYTASGLSLLTQYYWRIGTTINGTTDYSAANSFTTGSQGESGSTTITLINPVNGAVNQTTQLLFEWQAVAGVTYRFQVATSLTFGVPFIDVSGISSASYLANGFDYETVYYWRVGKEQGGQTSYSEPYSFTTGLQGVSGSFLTPPQLISPANSSTNMETNPILRWHSVAGALYTVQIANSPYFGELRVNQAGLTDTVYQVSGLYLATPYYWRIGATINGITEYSEARFFETGMQGSISGGLAAPSLASPANNSSINGLSINLNWGIVSNAASYGLQVSDDANFTNLIVNQTGLTSTSFQLNNLVNGRTYYWRTNASSSAETSSWSTVWNFTAVLPSEPPVVSIISPVNGFITNQSLIDIVWSVDGITQTTELTASLIEGENLIIRTSTDEAGNTGSDSVSVVLDTVPPVINLLTTVEGQNGDTLNVRASGTVTDSSEVTLTINGNVISLDQNNGFNTLIKLHNSITINVIAEDAAGNSSELSREIIYDNTPPILTLMNPIDGITVEEAGIYVSGKVKSNSNADVYINGQKASTDSEGFFETNLVLLPGLTSIEYRAINTSGIETIKTRTVTYVEPLLPPDPVDIATPIDPLIPTDIFEVNKFLYCGTNPIQRDIDCNLIDSNRICIIRGKVIDRDGLPLSGSNISILGLPEYGYTKTREDGWFDLVVNGGGLVTVKIEKGGYIEVHRKFQANYRSFETLDSVVLNKYDPKVTTIILADSIQTHKSSVFSDSQGQREAILLFRPGTNAKIHLPDGSIIEKDTFNVRATEFTFGDLGYASMPANLPSGTDYTYCVELSVDEAGSNNSKIVEFNKPVTFYLDNYYGFPAGTIVPSGYYNKEKAEWNGCENGIVIDILGKANNKALIDINGDGEIDCPDSLAFFNIDSLELQKIAQLYSVGQSVWRVPFMHFSTYDLNFSWDFLPQKDLIKSNNKVDDDKEDIDCGSIIGVNNRTLGEVYKFVNTPFSLVYNTKSKFNNRLTVMHPQIAEIGIDSTILHLKIAGKHYQKVCKEEDYAREVSILWDGKDAYGRKVIGKQPATYYLEYYTHVTEYKITTFKDWDFKDALYSRIEAVFANVVIYRGGGGSRGGYKMNPPEKREINRIIPIPIIRESKQTYLGAYEVADNFEFGGWSLNLNHRYDPIGNEILTGSGETFSSDLSSYKFDTNEIYNGGWAIIKDYAFDSENRMYILENNAVCRIEDNIKRYLYQSVYYGGVDCGLNSVSIPLRSMITSDHIEEDFPFIDPISMVICKDNSILIADRGAHKIFRLNADSTITVIAGTGVAGYSGDSDSAKNAQINTPVGIDVTENGEILFCDSGNGCIRKINNDGKIYTFAGIGNGPDSLDNVAIYYASLGTPEYLKIVGNEVYFTDSQTGKLRKINKSGIITTIAGSDTAVQFVEGTLANQTKLLYPGRFIVNKDGSILLNDDGQSKTLIISKEGYITSKSEERVEYTRSGPSIQTYFYYYPLLMNDRERKIYSVEDSRIIRRWKYPFEMDFSKTIISPDASQLWLFNKNYRHIKTISAINYKELLRFEYFKNRVSSIEDINNNTYIFERDTTGNLKGFLNAYNQKYTITLDTNKLISSITNPANETTSFEYDNNGLLTKLIEPKGGEHIFVYDSLSGELIKDIDPAGGFTELIQDKGYYKVTTKSAMGKEKSHRFFNFGGRDFVGKEVITPDGLAATTKYWNNGVIEQFNPDGTHTKYYPGEHPHYSYSVNVLKAYQINQPSGLKSELYHNIALTQFEGTMLIGQVDSFIVNGKLSLSEYDGILRRSRIVSSMGKISETYFDSIGRPISIHINGLNDVSVNYDSKGRITSAVQGGRESEITYNSLGFVSQTTDPLNRIQQFEYDAMGRVTRQVLSNGKEINYTYDANGNMTSLTPPGKAPHLFEHTVIDQVQGYLPPQTEDSSGVIRYFYNLDRQLLRTLQPDGRSIEIVYDSSSCGCGSSERISRLIFDRGEIKYEYYSATGNLSRVISPDSNSISYQYDGSLLTELKTEGLVNGKLNFEYNNDFNVVKATINDSIEIDYEYSDDGEILKAGETTFSYNAENGLPLGTQTGNVTTAYAYNGYGEVTEYTAKYQNAELFKTLYERDNSGRITKKTETTDNSTTVWEYEYNTIGYLVSTKKNGVITNQYSYDDNGNRTATAVIDTAAYDEQDRMLHYGEAEYVYGKNGDLRAKIEGSDTTKYDYDNMGNLRSVVLPNGNLIEYIIDANGRRIAKKVNGEIQKKWLYSGGLLPIAEVDSTDEVKVLYGSGYITKNDTIYKVVTDHLGSVRMIVNAGTGEVVQKIDYDEFGNITSVLNNDEFTDIGFAGGLYDNETGLTRFGARDFDPETGRWTSKDPILFEGGTSNLYEYCGNDPINSIDPEGLMDLIDVRDFTAGVISNLSFGATDWLLGQMGDLGEFNPCSESYSNGEWAGTAAGMLIGGASGTKAAMKNLGKTGFEFSHWIPKRAFKNLPSELNKLGKLKSAFNGNVVSKEFHALTDNFRHNFMNMAWKESNKAVNPALQQILRIPWTYGGAVGGSLTSLNIFN